MKITIVGQFGIESFGLHIEENLKAMGHDIVQCVSFGIDSGKKAKTKISKLSRIKNTLSKNMLFASKMTRDRVMKRVINSICEKTCDLVICTYDYFLDYEISMIKKATNAKIVMWYPDTIVNFGRAAFMTARYDACFFKDTYIVRQLRNIYNFNCFYLPEAFSPIRHHKMIYNENDERNYACDISIMGNLHSFRVPVLEFLLDYNLKVYGTVNPWWLNIGQLANKHTGKYASYDEKNKVIMYSKINLNTLYIGEIEGVNVRTFEIAGACGFQLLQYKKGLDNLFEIGKELDTFESIDDLMTKIDYYLSNDKLRYEIAEAGYRRAISCHTYDKRLSRLINMTYTSNPSSEDVFNYQRI